MEGNILWEFHREDIEGRRPPAYSHGIRQMTSIAHRISLAPEMDVLMTSYSVGSQAFIDLIRTDGTYIGRMDVTVDAEKMTSFYPVGSTKEHVIFMAGAKENEKNPDIFDVLFEFRRFAPPTVNK